MRFTTLATISPFSDYHGTMDIVRLEDPIEIRDLIPKLGQYLEDPECVPMDHIILERYLKELEEWSYGEGLIFAIFAPDELVQIQHRQGRWQISDLPAETTALYQLLEGAFLLTNLTWQHYQTI